MQKITASDRINLDEEGCVLCGQPTPFVGSTFCHGCWEVDHRIEEFLQHPAGVERVLDALEARIVFHPTYGTLAVPMAKAQAIYRLVGEIGFDPEGEALRRLLLPETEFESDDRKWVAGLRRILPERVVGPMLAYCKSSGRPVKIIVNRY